MVTHAGRDAFSETWSLDQESLGVHGGEKLAEDIKEKVWAMKEAQRKALASEAQLQEVQEAIEELQRQVSATEDELNSSGESRQQLEAECALLRQQCADAESIIRQLEEELQTFTKVQHEKEQEIQAKQEATEAKLQAMLATVVRTTGDLLAEKEQRLRAAEEEHSRQLLEQTQQFGQLDTLVTRLSTAQQRLSERREEKRGLTMDCTATAQDVSRVAAEVACVEKQGVALRTESSLRLESLEALREESRQLARRTVELRSSLAGGGDDQGGQEMHKDLLEERQHVEALVTQLLEARGHKDTAASRDVAEMTQCAESDEERLSILQDQIAFIEQALTEERSSLRSLEGIKDDLAAESAELIMRLRTLEEQLEDQQDHSNVQFAAIEQLQGEISQLEGDAELLTFGLHEAEQLGESLEKESDLMRQQVEGLYNGTLQELSAEVRRIKDAAELERHTDELNHWKKVAQEAERDWQSQIAEATSQHDKAMLQAKEELNALLQEVQRLQEERLKAATRDAAEAAGSVHSVPTAIQWLSASTQPLPVHAAHRRALVVGCNYNATGVPLKGCMNDVWNVQCILRHSLQYGEEQVRCLIDSSEFCPSPPSRQPTRSNILEGLRWLTSDASPTSTLFIYLSGYGCRQPTHPQGKPEAYFVPCDFLDDLPPDYQFMLQQAMRTQSHSSLAGIRPPPQGGFRLLAFRELTNVLLRLPSGCKVTLVLDCSCAAAAGVVTSSNTSTAAAAAAALAAPPPPPGVSDAIVPRQLSAASGRQLSGASSCGGGGGSDLDAQQSQMLSKLFSCRNRFLDLPPVQMPPVIFTPGMLQCQCYCYSACQSHQVSAEFPIEGCVQGAFTWSFIKALTAGHLKTTVQQHSAALQSMLADLRRHSKWLEQTPVVELSSSAGQRDYVLVRGAEHAPSAAQLAPFSGNVNKNNNVMMMTNQPS